MRSRLLAGLGAALLMPVLIVPPAAAVMGPMPDPAGDAATGMDITSVDVSEDPAGLVTISVTATPVVDTVMFLFVDLDGNASTRDPVDRVLIAVLSAPGVVQPSAAMYDASGDLTPVQVPGYTATATATGIDFAFTPRTLGAGQMISFFVATTLPGNTGVADVAPGNDSAWGYILGANVVSVAPVVSRPKVSGMRSGTRVTVTYAVTRKDTGEPLGAGAVDCLPTIAGRVVRHTESLAQGTVTVKFRLPRTAKGKTLRLKLTVTATDGSTDSRTSSFRIR